MGIYRNSEQASVNVRLNSTFIYPVNLRSYCVVKVNRWIISVIYELTAVVVQQIQRLSVCELNVIHFDRPNCPATHDQQLPFNVHNGRAPSVIVQQATQRSSLYSFLLSQLNCRPVISCLSVWQWVTRRSIICCPITGRLLYGWWCTESAADAERC